MNKLIASLIGLGLIFLVATLVQADSAEWKLDPTSGDWNTPDNWTPTSVPNGPADTATFAFSHMTSVSISANTEVDGITFTPAATNSYTITVSPGPGPFLFTLTLSGTGITNNSGTAQNFVTAVDGFNTGKISFTNSATAGTSTVFTNNGGAAFDVFGGSTTFLDTSTAGGGTFINNGSLAHGDQEGVTMFFDASTAGSGTFINNGGTVAGTVGGFIMFSDTSTAGSGIFISNGGTAAGAFGSGMDFNSFSTADSATLIANGGTNGGQGGTIFFSFDTTGGTSRVEVFGNGSLDISHHHVPGVTIGSIEGDGNVFLGGNNLTVGSNPLSTTFAGVIQDGGQGGGTGGSLTKIGMGILDLTGANTYTGDTNINGGVLKVNGSISSNTFVNSGGTLAGTGTVQGNVTNNNGGTVSPGDAPGTLTINGNYTQAQFATLMIQIAGDSAGQFSVLNVLGHADLNGTLEPVLLNGFIPMIGDSFVFLNYASLTGAFSRIENPVFNNGTERWEVTYQSTDAILTATKNVPDQSSTLLLLTLSLLGLVTYRQSLRHKRA